MKVDSSNLASFGAELWGNKSKNCNVCKESFIITINVIKYGWLVKSKPCKMGTIFSHIKERAISQVSAQWAHLILPVFFLKYLWCIRAWFWNTPQSVRRSIRVPQNTRDKSGTTGRCKYQMTSIRVLSQRYDADRQPNDDSLRIAWLLFSASKVRSVPA